MLFKSSGLYGCYEFFRCPRGGGSFRHRGLSTHPRPWRPACWFSPWRPAGALIPHFPAVCFCFLEMPTGSGTGFFASAKRHVLAWRQAGCGYRPSERRGGRARQAGWVEPPAASCRLAWSFRVVCDAPVHVLGHPLVADLAGLHMALADIIGGQLAVQGE